MPQRRQYRKKAPKRTYRRKTTKGQRRFRRKRFAKTPGLRSTTIPKVMMCKLQYTKIFSSTVSATDQWGTVSTNGLTYPITAQTASLCWNGSHFCTPMGDPIIPASFSAGGGVIATVTEDYPIALQDWSTFYEEAICFGSSISITMYPNSNSGLNSLRYVLIPVAAQEQVDIYQPSSTASTGVRYKFDQLDYMSLLSYPGCRSGYIKDVGAGPTRVKMFRKTKSMLGMTNIKDSQFALTMSLPTAAAPQLGSNTPEADPNTYAASASSLGWLWYFRVFSATSTGISPTVEFTVRIKYYAQLQTRRQLTQIHYTPA